MANSQGQHVIDEYVKEYKKSIYSYLGLVELQKSKFPSFAELPPLEEPKWIATNYEKFLLDSPNAILAELSYLSEMGYITALAYSASGGLIVAGHSTGLVQARNSATGKVQYTLRKSQFPPRPVYALQCSRLEERICYACCTDGIVYRLEIPALDSASCADYYPASDQELDTLTVQYFGAQNEESNVNATPFFTSRSPAISLSVFSDNTKIAIGYADSCIKIVDIETREVAWDIKKEPLIHGYAESLCAEFVNQFPVPASVTALSTYKMHKLRMDLLPKRLQRVHKGQVSALECHPERQNVFASGSWDRTLRAWDIRCQVGCMMTFEGVNIIGNSIDLNRDILVVGSWQPMEALTTWDIRAHKKLSIIRAQNRRVDIDGEYFYACKFWKSSLYNRKSKYAIVAGSGTDSVEIINLHNRYISCCFPARGATLAVASFEDKIAWGGTHPTFSIACFHDPKHETEAYRGDYDDVDVDMWAEEAETNVMTSKD